MTGCSYSLSISFQRPKWDETEPFRQVYATYKLFFQCASSWFTCGTICDSASISYPLHTNKEDLSPIFLSAQLKNQNCSSAPLVILVNSVWQSILFWSSFPRVRDQYFLLLDSFWLLRPLCISINLSWNIVFTMKDLFQCECYWVRSKQRFPWRIFLFVKYLMGSIRRQQIETAFTNQHRACPSERKHLFLFLNWKLISSS